MLFLLTGCGRLAFAALSPLVNTASTLECCRCAALVFTRHRGRPPDSAARRRCLGHSSAHCAAAVEHGQKAPHWNDQYSSIASLKFEKSASPLRAPRRREAPASAAPLIGKFDVGCAGANAARAGAAVPLRGRAAPRSRLRAPTLRAPRLPREAPGLGLAQSLCGGLELLRARCEVRGGGDGARRGGAPGRRAPLHGQKTYARLDGATASHEQPRAAWPGIASTISASL